MQKDYFKEFTKQLNNNALRKYKYAPRKSSLKLAHIIYTSSADSNMLNSIVVNKINNFILIKFRDHITIINENGILKNTNEFMNSDITESNVYDAGMYDIYLIPSASVSKDYFYSLDKENLFFKMLFEKEKEGLYRCICNDKFIIFDKKYDGKIIGKRFVTEGKYYFNIFLLFAKSKKKKYKFTIGNEVALKDSKSKTIFKIRKFTTEGILIENDKIRLKVKPKNLILVNNESNSKKQAPITQSYKDVFENEFKF